MISVFCKSCNKAIFVKTKKKKLCECCLLLKFEEKKKRYIKKRVAINAEERERNKYKRLINQKVLEGVCYLWYDKLSEKLAEQGVKYYDVSKYS